MRSAFVRRPSSSTKRATTAELWLGDHAQDFDLDLIVRTTPSSYASFALVAARLAGAPALITTVDTIMPVDAFRHFVDSAASFPSDAVVLGLTAHVDDENPLWATLHEDGRIRGLGAAQGSHVTAGIYWLPAQSIAAPAAGFGRLRDYLKWLVEAGQPVYGVVLPLVFDIDRARDVEAAELAGLCRPLRTQAHEHGPDLCGRAARARPLARTRR